MRNRIRIVGGSAIAIAAWLLVWEAASQLNWLDLFLAPPPSTLVATAWELLTEGFPDGIPIQGHILATIGRVVADSPSPQFSRSRLAL